MSMLPAAGKLETMSADECVKRLRAQHLGRLALVDHDGRPLIFPINYFFDEGLVAFRTGQGTKLDLAPGAHVAFEIDGWDADIGFGWSVVVTGIARDFTRTRGVPAARIAFWPVRPLAPGSRENLIAIQADDISGRWFRSAAHRPTT
jgi:nitroimidazol reductase NimA-like FMN-containing flavoprotein (pyridoxamine 5'-phosphate oxidase superfamily)